MSSFLDSIGPAPVTKQANPGLFRVNRKQEMRNAAYLKAAQQQIQHLPGNEESMHFIVNDNYRPWEVIPATISMMPSRRLDELWIATFSFTTDTVQAMLKIADAGQIGAIHLICGDMFTKHKPEFFKIIGEEFAKRGHQLKAARNHAKVILMRSGADCFTVEGSANLSACTNIEQLCMTKSEPLFRFHTEWMRKVFDGRQAKVAN